MKLSEFKRNYRRVKNAWIPRQAKRACAGKHRGPNATEARYRREELRGIPEHLVKYEAKTFTITQTTKREYTPDWVVSANYGFPPQYHEVKGSYKLGSEDRARLAWELAAERNPQAIFYWAVLTRRGWEIEEWQNGGETIRVKLAGEDEWRYVGPDWRSHRPRKAKRK